MMPTDEEIHRGEVSVLRQTLALSEGREDTLRQQLTATQKENKRLRLLVARHARDGCITCIAALDQKEDSASIGPQSQQSGGVQDPSDDGGQTGQRTGQAASRPVGGALSQCPKCGGAMSNRRCIHESCGYYDDSPAG